jgi:hypothetical protein
MSALRRFAKKASVPLASQFYLGHLRTLRPNEQGAFLWTERMLTKDRGEHAKRFLAVPEVHKMLDLRHANLAAPLITDVPALSGYRATFTQTVTASGGRQLRVRNGYVDVTMDNQGRVFKLANTLRHGSRNLDLDGIISDEQAIAIAKQKLGWNECDVERSELVASSWDRPCKGKSRVRCTMDPVYEVVLSTPNPRRSMLLLIHARTSKVLHSASLTHTIKAPRSVKRRFAKNKPRSVEEAVMQIFSAQTVPQNVTTNGDSVQNAAGKRVQGYGILRVPDPDIDIVKQYYKVILSSLTDTKVLANENFKVYVAMRRSPVRAKPDGTFNYKPNEPEFSAVVAFFALNIQWELMKNWGMSVPEGTAPADVRVECPGVDDNAQFDQVTREISVGKGTGVLTRYIAYDISILFHEGGHHVVYMLAPGNDLGGVQGAMCHEGLADMQALELDWWFQLKFAKTLGYTITVADIKNSLRKVGWYAMPPDGIRQQKNKAKPTKTRDPHDGCLPIGGAMSDVMVNFVEAKGIETGLETFGKLMNGAVAGVPRGKVTFIDLLDAFLAADDRQNKGGNKPVIVQKFDDHGIRLPSAGGKSGGTGSPIIVVNP